MDVTVSEELRSFVARGIASGRFRSEDEAISEGLKLLQRREEKLDALKSDVQIGIQELDAGDKSDLDIEDIKTRGRARLQQRQGNSE